MAITRSSGRRIVGNKHESYENMFEERGVKEITQFSSPHLDYPTPQQIASLSTVDHIWRQGDRYYKLANTHYGNAKLWWVIAWFNKKPTEGHVKLGDIIKIPLPIEVIMRYYGV